jgi:hypothetical protein
MATYQSRQVQDNMPIPSHGLAVDTKCQRFSVAIGAALTTADNIEFGRLPDFARVVDAILVATDLDTNGSPTLALNVGDSGDADRFFAASNVGQAATAARMTATTGFGYRYGRGGGLVTGKPSTNAATGAAGTIDLYVFYVVDDPGAGTP